MSSGPVAVLRAHPMFRRYFLGQAVSLTGMWMQQVALTLVIVKLTSSKTAIASITFVSSLPMVFLGMPAGVLADRYDRRRILIVTQLLFAAFAFAFAAFYTSNALTLFWLYVLAMGHACVIAMDMPAMQAFVPDLVPPDAIPQAVALNGTLVHGTRLIGPALASLIIAISSPTMAFAANGLSYFAVVYSLWIVRPPGRPVVIKKPGSGGLREAFAFVDKHTIVQGLLGYFGLSTLLIFPVLLIFLGVYILDVLGGDDSSLGIVMSTSGGGALIGTLLLLRVRAELRGPLIVAMTALTAVMLFLQSLSTGVAMAAAVQFGMSFSISLGMGLASTIIQVVVPGQLRGRIMAIMGVMFTGFAPTAGLGLGVLADHIGLRMTMRVLAVAYLVIAIPWLIRAGLWRRESHAPAVVPQVG